MEFFLYCGGIVENHHNWFVESTNMNNLFRKLALDVGRPSVTVGVIGEVNVGKSTTINAIMGQKISNVSMRRTTMRATVYTEDTSKQKNDESARAKFLQSLQEFEEKWRNDEKKKMEQVEVDQLRVATIPNFVQTDELQLNVMDMPGTNDATYDEVIFDFYQKNSRWLDLILLIIDCKSAFNTKSEITLLDKILDDAAKIFTSKYYLCIQ